MSSAGATGWADHTIEECVGGRELGLGELAAIGFPLTDGIKACLDRQLALGGMISAILRD